MSYSAQILSLSVLLGCDPGEIVLHTLPPRSDSKEIVEKEGEEKGEGEIAGYDDGYSIMTVSGADGDDLSGFDDGIAGVLIPGAYMDQETGAVKANQNQLARARRVRLAKEKKKAQLFSTVNTGQCQSYIVTASSTSATNVLQVSTEFFGRYLIFAAAGVTAGAVLRISNISINRNVNVLGGQTTTSSTTFPGEIIVPEVSAGRWLVVDLGADEGMPFRKFTQSSIISFSCYAYAASGTPVGLLQVFFRSVMSDTELAGYTVVSTASFNALEQATRI